MAIDSTSSANDVLRFSGMSSGLDTDAIIESLTQIDQIKVDKQEQETTELEWKAEELREVNLALRSFKDNYNSILSENSMVSSSTYNSFSVSLSGNTSAVSISAGSSSDTGAMQIDEITQLASAAQVESIGIFSTAEDSIKSTKLSELGFSGTALTFDAGEISFSINGTDFTFDSDTTVSDMMSEVNASDAGVKMSYSTLKNGFKITSTNTGSTEGVDIQNIKGNAFAADAGDAAFGIATGEVFGTDAQLVIEGISVTKSTNDFTIDGISYSLKTTSDTAIEFNIERDVQSTVDKITDYIESYNTLIEDLNARIDEEYYRDYTPLTDAQKDEMTETEIENWEEKAKSGMLKNNNTIRNTLNSLRSAFYESVAATGLMPADIGLTTSYDYEENGKIIIDEDKLTQAIVDNPSVVQDLFVSRPDDDSTSDRADSGLVVRIDDIIASHISSTTDNEIASTDDRIEDSEDRMQTLIDRMEANRSIHWAKFNALEVALSRMNSQSNALFAQMGMTSE